MDGKDFLAFTWYSTCILLQLITISGVASQTTPGLQTPTPFFPVIGSTPSPGTPYLQVEAPMNNETALLGGHVTLYCRIRGYPAPKYWWYHNGVYMTDGGVGRYSIKTYNGASILRIRNVDTLDMGPYKCTARNSAGEKSVIGRITLSADGPVFSASESESQLAGERCERYHGSVCRAAIEQTNVYISADQDQDTIEESIDEAILRISRMSTISDECKKFIIPSICLTAFPLCSERSSRLTTHRICAGDCNQLEKNVCAALYNYVDSTGDSLGMALPVCSDLPPPGTEGRNTCISFMDETGATVGPLTPPNGDYIALERAMNNETDLHSGDKVTLRCRISGYPMPTFSWFKNDALLTDERLGKRIFIKSFDWGSKLSIRNVDTTDTGYYTCKGQNRAGMRQTTGILFARYEDPSNTPVSYEPTTGVCQEYTGATCANIITNKTIYVTQFLSQEQLEIQLHTAFNAIWANLTKECQRYAIPSLCRYAFPQCIPASPQPKRQELCREECEILEEDICKLEYQRAKLHPRVILPNCRKLPIAGSPAAENCMRIDIPSVLKITNDKCYNKSGVHYRGKINRTKSGYACQPWQSQEPHQHNLWPSKYHELAGGHNYCRNPGDSMSKPWCLTMNPSKRVEECDIMECVYTEPPPASIDMLAIILPAIAIGAVAIILVGCICLCWRQSQANSYSNANSGGPSRHAEMTALQQNNKVRDFPRAAIKFQEVLGMGTFGKVFRGDLMGVEHQYSIVPVTIKTLQEPSNSNVQQDFKREAQVMGSLHHPNIISLLGVCLKDRPMCMFFEYMPHGDLHEFLVRHSPNSDVGFGSGDEDTQSSLDQADFMSMAIQVASGMEYLSSRHFVHRDLAARNCMVGENLQIKIADFGLSRDVYSGDYYRMPSQAVLPIRWMSPEAIMFGRFSVESDVWAFGVVLWEIYSYGLQPFYGYKNQEVLDMIRTRHILPCPNGCPTHIYALMMECWHEIPQQRLEFKVICARLRALESLPLHSTNGHTFSAQLNKSNLLAHFGPKDTTLNEYVDTPDAGYSHQESKPGIVYVPPKAPSDRSGSSRSSGYRKLQETAMEQTQV